MLPYDKADIKLKITKNEIRPPEDKIFYQIIKAENKYVKVVIRHIKTGDKPFLNVEGTPTDSGFVGFEYDGSLANIVGTTFSIKLYDEAQRMDEDKVDEYIEILSTMLQIAKDTIKEVKDLIMTTDMRKYLE